MEVLGGSCFTYQQLPSTSIAILAATGCGHKEEEARLLLCWINAHIIEHLQSCLVGGQHHLASYRPTAPLWNLKCCIFQCG